MMNSRKLKIHSGFRKRKNGEYSAEEKQTDYYR